MQAEYDAAAIEKKWHEIWERERAFEVPIDPADVPEDRAYVLEMLPYPSGTLHMGHVLVYTIGDAMARARRRQGATVLHPIGFDSFGLPAENAAIRAGGTPQDIVERNIAHISSEMRQLGWSLDWSRVLAAHTPEYYAGTQWLFLRLYEAGLAYRKAAPVNWCPRDQVVLANEQVRDGHCEYCGTEVVARYLDQWFFRTSDYAQALLDDLESLNWSESVKAIQRHWIGRSDGAEIAFLIDGLQEPVWVFTTRPDTLFGATFIVLAPEHPVVAGLAPLSRDPDAVEQYVRLAAAKRVEERAAAEDKTGVDTGLRAVHPFTGDLVPVWIADYVLMDYGTGAVMGVPAHDDRDLSFATQHELSVVTVIDDADRLAASGRYTGMNNRAAGTKIVDDLERVGKSKRATSYRLRDWGFSRQRYWGCPIPIIYCEDCEIVPVPDDELPLRLPAISDFRPGGIAPLASATDWVRAPCPRCGKPGRREVETMDTFVDSSWYFLRYCDPHRETAPFERRMVDRWCPVDQYVGGIDHAVMHLIYARFFVKALNDLGLLGFREPFLGLFTNGWVKLDGSKMSKSKGNMVGPDDFVATYGADAVRLYILSIGPASEDIEWTDDGIEAMTRFVRRVHRLVGEVIAVGRGRSVADNELARAAHRTIARVSKDLLDRQTFHTAIASIRELVNALSHAGPKDDAAWFAAETVASLLEPFAPHLAEELWEGLGHERLWGSPWPVADAGQLTREKISLAVQINGKLRDVVEVPIGLSREEVTELASQVPRIAQLLANTTITRTVVVPDRLVNFVF